MIKSFIFNTDDELIANSYIIGKENKGCVIVDLGCFNKRISEYIKSKHNGIVYGVLLTHGHFDHIKGLNDFLKEYTPTIFIHEDEVEFLENTRLNCSSVGNDDVIVNYSNIYRLDDEDEIRFADNMLFKVIHTPGHTRGSVCYLYESENALFSGDTLFKNTIGRCDLPSGSKKAMDNSLKKLSLLDENIVVYPGHGETTTIKKEFKIGGK